MVPVKPSPTLDKPRHWSEEINDFLAKCVTKEPEKRPTSAQLMTHPFILKTKGPEVLQERIKMVKKIRHTEAITSQLNKVNRNHTKESSGSGGPSPQSESPGGGTAPIADVVSKKILSHFADEGTRVIHRSSSGDRGANINTNNFLNNNYNNNYSNNNSINHHNSSSSNNDDNNNAGNMGTSVVHDGVESGSFNATLSRKQKGEQQAMSTAIVHEGVQSGSFKATLSRHSRSLENILNANLQELVEKTITDAMQKQQDKMDASLNVFKQEILARVSAMEKSLETIAAATKQQQQ